MRRGRDPPQQQSGRAGLSWELRLGLVLGASLALGWAVQAALRAWLWRWRGRRAARRGARGERAARALLERAGYRVLAEQPRHQASLEVSGEDVEYLLVPDFLCERGGQRYVADAKTGAGADPQARATRRQLLEYACAFEAAGALVVDVPGRRIHRLRFGVLEGRGRSGWGWGWLLLGALAAWLWLAEGGPPSPAPAAAVDQGVGRAPK